jgi:hypothetical protein
VLVVAVPSRSQSSCAVHVCSLTSPDLLLKTRLTPRLFDVSQNFLRADTSSP